MIQPETVQLSQSDSVAILTLNRPEKHNALNQDMREQLLRHLECIAQNDSLRVVLLTGGQGPAFCVGMDLNEFVGRTGIEQWERDLDPNRLYEVMARFPKPIIAVINGFAFGGGCELALACDIRVSSDEAEFGLLEINFGLIPGGGGTQRLTRLAGKGQAMRLIFTGDKISAEEAERVGLVEKVVKKEDLAVFAMNLAERIASQDPTALRRAKEAINAVDEMTLSAGLKFEAGLMGTCIERGSSKSKIKAFLKIRNR